MSVRIETSRLELREFAAGDARELFELYKLDETSEYESWNPHENLEDSVGLLNYWLNHQKEKPRLDYTLAVTFKDQFIGLCGVELGFGTETDDSRVGFLGYRIHPDYWNHGFATECGHGLLRFAFKELALHRIHSGCSAENIASQRVLEKLGFRVEGTTKQSFPINERWTDYQLFGMLKTEFLTRT